MKPQHLLADYKPASFDEFFKAHPEIADKDEEAAKGLMLAWIQVFEDKTGETVSEDGNVDWKELQEAFSYGLP